jgi:hypothetical protein
MKKLLTIFLFPALIMTFGCKKDKTPQSVYTIVNNGDAGVTSITDAQDQSELEIVQAVPSVSNASYPSTIPIMFFFNDKIYLNSLNDDFTVEQNGKIVGGTITINKAANGYAILTFTPSQPFSVGADITITIKKAVQDDGGNGLFEDYVLTFKTVAGATESFDSNKGFESGTTGVLFMGDGAVLSGTQGSVSPGGGSKFGVITSGNLLVSSGSSIGGASSLMLLGPINTDLSSLTFNYDFSSAEFNEFVDSEFDDCAVVTIYGPKGSYSVVMTSVNLIGTANTQTTGFAGLPDDGDTYAGHTGWVSKTYSFPNVGTPAYIIFTVTDVADQIYSSALAVDDISY